MKRTMRVLRVFALTAALISGLVQTAAALEVDQAELESAGSADSIVFINYNGPHAVIDSLEAIKAIGSNLGNQIADRTEQLTTAGEQNRYYVIHAVDPQITTGLDADIIMLGSNAGVDHIRNLRYIIAAYLQAAYGYDERDAQTLAVFTTVYNAVYRGNLDYYTSKYKPIVSSYLTKENVGLSTNYADWPGQTQIVIPLSDPTGTSLGTIDTSVISDKNVVDSMRENEDDMGVDTRKDMVDMKDREADQLEGQAEEAQQDAAEAQQQADIEKQQLEQEEQKLRDEQKKLEQSQKEAAAAEQAAQDAQQQAEEKQQAAQDAQQQAEEKQQAAQDAQQIARENPDDEQAQQNAQQAQQDAQQAQQDAQQAQQDAQQAQQDAQQAQQDAQQAQQNAQQQEQTVQKQEEVVQQQEQAAQEKQQTADEKQQIAQEKQEAADQKREEARRDRTEIAKDQQKLLALEQQQGDDTNATYGLKLIDEQKLLSAMVKVNTETGEVIKTSPVSVIRGRTLLPTGTAYAAIAGENTGNGAIRLVLLDKQNMEIILESNETVSENSILLQINDAFYVIAQKNGWRIAKYDTELNLLLTSTIEVNPSTPVSVTEAGSLCVNDSQGNIRLLKLTDLSPVK